MIRLPGLNGDCCICIEALDPSAENYRCIRSDCKSGSACVKCWTEVQDQSACPVCRVNESDMVTDDPLILDALFNQGRVYALDRSLKKHARDSQWFVQVFRGADRLLAEACVSRILLAWWEFDVSVLEVMAMVESKYPVLRHLPRPECRHSHEQMKPAIDCLEAMEWMVRWLTGRALLHQGLMCRKDQENITTWSHSVRMARSRVHFDLYYKLATAQAQFPRERERDLFLAVFGHLWFNTSSWAFDWLCPLALKDPELLNHVRPLRLKCSQQSDSAGLLQLVLAENTTLVFWTEFSDRRLEESAARYPLRYRLDRRGLFAFFRGDSEWTRIGQDLPSNNYESMFAFNDRTRNVLYWSDDQEVDTNDEQKFTVVDLNGQALFRAELIREGANLEIFKDGYYRSVVPVPGKVYKFTNFLALSVAGEDKAKRVSKRKYYRLE